MKMEYLRKKKKRKLIDDFEYKYTFTYSNVEVVEGMFIHI